MCWQLTLSLINTSTLSLNMLLYFDIYDTSQVQGSSAISRVAPDQSALTSRLIRRYTVCYNVTFGLFNRQADSLGLDRHAKMIWSYTVHIWLKVLFPVMCLINVDSPFMRNVPQASGQSYVRRQYILKSDFIHNCPRMSEMPILQWHKSFKVHLIVIIKLQL